jgi:hypothetical protein
MTANVVNNISTEPTLKQRTFNENNNNNNNNKLLLLLLLLLTAFVLSSGALIDLLDA